MHLKTIWIVLALILIISVVVLCIIHPNRDQSNDANIDQSEDPNLDQSDNPDIDQWIELASKEEIIDGFKNNEDLFLSVAEFANSTEGDLYVFYNPNNGDKIIENTSNESGIENLSTEARESIDKILIELKYMGIYEYGQEEIYFKRNTGGIEQGICYLGKSVDPIFLEEKEHITGNWYYYATTHP